MVAIIMRHKTSCTLMIDTRTVNVSTSCKRAPFYLFVPAFNLRFLPHTPTLAPSLKQVFIGVFAQESMNSIE